MIKKQHIYSVKIVGEFSDGNVGGKINRDERLVASGFSEALHLAYDWIDTFRQEAGLGNTQVEIGSLTDMGECWTQEGK